MDEKGITKLIAGFAIGVLVGVMLASVVPMGEPQLTKCMVWNETENEWDSVGYHCLDFNDNKLCKRYEDGWIGERCRIMEVC